MSIAGKLIKQDTNAGVISDSTRITTEEQLINVLKQMHSDYRQKELEERKAEASAALPEEPDYEFKTYEGESEDEIRNRVQNEYGAKLESEKSLQTEKTKTKTDELAGKVESAYDDYGKTEDEILASLEKNKKQNENKMIESGLSRSSIKELVGESAQQQAVRPACAGPRAQPEVERKHGQKHAARVGIGHLRPQVHADHHGAQRKVEVRALAGEEPAGAQETQRDGGIGQQQRCE